MIEAYFDGAFLWEEGHAAYGAIIRLDGSLLFEESKYMGANKKWSSNCAEYAGAITILKFLLSRNLTRHVTVFGDSSLVVRQMNGQWKAKAGAYLDFYREALLLKAKLVDVRFKWIPRAKNDEADLLSKLPLKPYYHSRQTEDPRTSS